MLSKWEETGVDGRSALSIHFRPVTHLVLWIKAEVGGGLRLPGLVERGMSYGDAVLHAGE